ncbi:MAG: hypothetical protein UR28_C0007G0035 [Candidatus Peregrinibacteria bacterium GW2011_GWF2_33_10]|nr:MAG: hypothetical protein UR28_C0007G0035 [Candidatus Peregrinibacteria bacterium GW2011_GWF2_33_10]OGJ44591.1 MAG: hypothetical protein A2272_01730 [Candidatus Peregrinibacteria bacterium RIFOXYA12_FULL_33_12]OGJ44921.1 MAG: hypothetical protein A2263_03280 [Candidatus Peregrinibacteria bacterium RIFOXYA2_FULL_33_21]OGJ50680.1 MAG: hypothetical protein A2307_03570 [Candidatus Peregrinibacteria bacterium RIFOXYB2_FULL_33_20]
MKKILLLEDEEALGRIYKKRLDMAGYETLWTRTAEETEKVIPNFPADVILIDHAIKGHEKSGLDIVPNLRKHIPNAKLIVLSNYDKSNLQEEIKGLNIDDFLLKIETPPSQLVKYLDKMFVTS